MFVSPFQRLKRYCDALEAIQQRYGDLKVKTVSLDDPVPGTDGLTWQDIITEDNLEYTPYIMEVS